MKGSAMSTIDVSRKDFTRFHPEDAIEASRLENSAKSVNGSDIELPRSLKVAHQGDIAIVSLARPEKCNALDTATVLGLEALFTSLPEEVRAVVLVGEGKHFCAGLDLGEFTERNIADSVAHSRIWHRAFERIESGRVPVIAVLHGAVIGGGLEIAAACHLRVAENSTYYALPEAIRGFFVGGGGAVRLPRLIGTARMMDMMLTGRIYEAEEGQAIGISHYLVPPDAGLAKGMEIAKRIASNSPISNFAITHALPRIAQSGATGGYLTEALIAAIAQHSDEAKARLKEFREKRAPKTIRN
jgi:enoyl-CoA hydratase/carnithine racemase